MKRSKKRAKVAIGVGDDLHPVPEKMTYKGSSIGGGSDEDPPTFKSAK